MPKVAVGGTFYPLHDGHKALLKKAVELCSGDELVIGLTSDKMAKRKSHEIAKYSIRYNNIMDYVKTLGIIPKILELNDKFGITISEDFDYIVVSPETYPTSLEINKIRQKKGLKKIKIVVVNFVLAENGASISSTRILKKEIDEHGNLIN